MPSPSQTTSPSSTEIIRPGHVSKRLETALQSTGKGIADAQILQALDEADSAKNRYATAAIVAGLALLAKQAQLGAGRFKPYLRKLLSVQRVAPQNQGNNPSIRTAFIYTSLARRFLWKIETGAFADEAIDPTPLPQVAALDVTQIAQLQALTSDQQASIITAIERFVAGRSLRRLLADFREAEKAAEEEDREAEKADTPTEEEPADGGPPADMRHAVQLDFLNTLSGKVKELDELFGLPDAVTLEKEQWLKLADALEERAKIARARAV